MPSPIVFLDVAGPDAERLRAFYAAVFDWQLDAEHRAQLPAAPLLDAAIREDPPEVRIYFGVEDVSAALVRVVAHGGHVDAERFEVPGVVVLGLFRDPAGNPLGLVELDGSVPRVP